ncbi:TonB C-terminal domain-containing protein [bacterium]|nr:TonB C-terminal domain-containing protein [bacterium]
MRAVNIKKYTLPLLDIRKAIVFSICLHILILGMSSFLKSFYYKKTYWVIEPVELIPFASSTPVIKKTAKKQEKKKKEKKKVIIPSKEKPIVKKKIQKSKEKKEDEKNTITQKEETIQEVQPTGGIVSIEGKKFPFAYYLELIQNKINHQWRSPCNVLENKKVVVFFKVLKGGQVKNISLEESSGVFLLDQSALRAIWQSAPFPPLPQGYKKDFLNVHFKFELKLQQEGLK